MPLRTRHFAVVALLLGFSLGGCGTINEKLSGTVSDAIPAWAGGLPADAPPRPGSPKYDEYVREQERKRVEPAVPKNPSDPSSASALAPVH
jgi:hypothetical protein